MAWVWYSLPLGGLCLAVLCMGVLSSDSGSSHDGRMKARLYEEVNPSSERSKVNRLDAESNEIFRQIEQYSKRKSRKGVERRITEAAANPCAKVRCKAGKECTLDKRNRPKCVCINECPDDLSLDEAVCGTDNNTYASECALHRLKCVGSQDKKLKKKVRRLKVNYLGPCKELTSCKKSELVEYPTRMRSWIKNVFLEMYETPAEEGGLSEKQRHHGRKVFESREKLQDFEEATSPDLMKREFVKFYPLYRYPIHWQFAKLDRRPRDKFLNKRELEPLRAPLIPMEHCTKTFFKRADKNRDKQISLVEWGQALGLREDDIDPRLAF